MTRQSHVRPGAGTRGSRSGSPTGGRLPGEVEAFLALQRQIGNAGVGALVGRDVIQRADEATTVDGDDFFDARSQLSAVSAPDSDVFFDAEDGRSQEEVGATTLADVAEVARQSLESQSDVSIDPAQLLATLTPPPSPPPSPEPAAVGEEAAAGPSRFRRVVDGDEAKMTGAGLATAGPFTGLANNASPSLGLMAGATGGSSLTAAGDAVSELLKGHRSATGYDVVNWPKVIGGVLAFGGLAAAAAGTGLGVPGLRAGGMMSQSAGLLIKSAGEGWKFEKGSTPWNSLPDSDIAKAAGAFAASVAPALAAGAFLSEPELAKMLTSSALASGTTGSQLLKAALWFAAGSGAGDFASEVVKGVHDGKVNPAKMWGGLLQATGAFTFAGGALWRNLDARNAGLVLQAAGLVSKSVGEGRKLENSPAGAWPGALTKKKVPASAV
ncbi:hypothetical protein [Actinoplanes sp. NPDC051494]|uniref:hypothetical protein n=1 Tax=Actinoplanes sp. NPDC051494 TaxID=3363907 RepID=UPI0037B31365